MNEKQENLSVYIVIDSKPNKNNLCKIYARFIQGKKKKEHFLKIRWPRDKFDVINQQVLPRYANDPDVEFHNHRINSIKVRINKLQVDAYVKNRNYCIEDYVQVIDNHATLADFIWFMSQNIRREFTKGIIAEATYKNHKSTLKNIQLFFGEKLPSANITLQSIQEFDAFHRKLGKKKNTISSYHKVFCKYLNQALDRGLIDKNPYDSFKTGWVPGDRVALTQDEVKRLYQTFLDQTLPLIEHEVLRRFLFSCLTGLRISDTAQIDDSNIRENNIVIVPKKTTKSGKILTIPMPTAAKKLIDGRKGKLFVPLADQSINRILKRIASIVGVNERISYHSARDTFGTVFIELGGDIKSLCDLMGHSSTKITEIYLKMADKRKVQLMNNFDSLF